MRLTATALTQPLSARIQVKTYPFSSIPSSKRAFCSQACARIVAVREYRARLRSDAQKRETVKEKERKRGKQRYRKKVLNK